jgi:hypothetical protein
MSQLYQTEINPLMGTALPYSKVSGVRFQVSGYIRNTKPAKSHGARNYEVFKEI